MMNQDLLRVFEIESDYDSAKPDFVYPTVSYVRDVDEVRYMSKLPVIDTSDLQTHFILWQSYPDVVPIFQAIYNDYGECMSDNIDGTLTYLIDGEESVISVEDDSLWMNYLSELTISRSSEGMIHDVITIVINENNAVLINEGYTIKGTIEYSSGNMVDNQPH